MTFSRALQGAFVFAMAAWLIATSGVAQADEKADLKARFKQRDVQLTLLKKQGTLGETWQGFVDATKKESLDDSSTQLMQQENADRKRLYEILGHDTNEKSADVGVRNAMRNFAMATTGEFLKAKVGPWVRRGDVTTLKREGKIGETWDGYVAIVAGVKDEDSKLEAVIFVENSARKYLYGRQAQENKTTASLEAERAGSRNLSNAKPGDFVRGKDGAWQKK